MLVLKQHARKECWRRIYFLLGFLVFAVVMFFPALKLGVVKFATDANIGWMSAKKAALPYSFLGWFRDDLLLGDTTIYHITFNNLLLWLFPVKFYSNWIYAINLVLASFFLMLYLRLWGRSFLACTLASVVAFWVGSTFTLNYAGHIFKFGVVMHAAAFLWLSEKAVRQHSVLWSILAGGAAGGMFLEQPDVALFFSFLLGPYLLLRIFWDPNRITRQLLRVILPISLIAVSLAFRPLWLGYTMFVKDVAVMAEDPDRKWEYVTQWSWPPNECLDFIAPGYFGYRSNEPEGPYYGKLGRSAGWDESRQGFRNFKLEGEYLGILPITLSLFALAIAIVGAPGDRLAWRMVLFWSGACALTLVLSFGKFTPVYWLFFQLPMVSSIRAPVKFLQVFQLALGVLTAVGIDGLALPGRELKQTTGARTVITRRFFYGLLAMGVVLLFSLMAVSSQGSEAFINQGFTEKAAKTIGKVRVKALVHAFLVCAGCCALFWACLRAKAGKKTVFAIVLPVLLIGLAGLDSFAASRPYVKTLDMATVRANSVIARIKSDLEYQRVALATQQGFYNNWLSVLFPYHHIATINVSQMPRMSEDYKTYLGHMQRNPGAHWYLGSVRYVITPSQFVPALFRTPEARACVEPVNGFNLTYHPETGIQVVPVDLRKAQHVLLRIRNDLPRYALFHHWEYLDDESVLKKLSTYRLGQDYTPAVEIKALTYGDPPSQQGEKRTVQVHQYEANRVSLKISADKPGLLRICDKFDRFRKAYVDGESVPMYRCDYIVSCIFVSAGEHEVEIIYRPEIYSLGLQMGGMGISLLSALVLLVPNKKRVTPRG